MTPYAGQTVRIEFLVHGDNAGDWTNMYVDDVLISGPCGSTTPTDTPTVAPPTDTVYYLRLSRQQTLLSLQTLLFLRIRLLSGQIRLWLLQRHAP